MKKINMICDGICENCESCIYDVLDQWSLKNQLYKQPLTYNREKVMLQGNLRNQITAMVVSL